MTSMTSMTSERDDEIIKAAYFYRFMTAEQVKTRFFTQGQGSYVRTLLFDLKEREYLHRFILASKKKGEKPFIYTLGKKGIKLLKDMDIEPQLRFTVSIGDVSYEKLKHDLATVDIVIAAELLQRDPTYTLIDSRPGWMLKHSALPAIPDWFLNFRFRMDGRLRGSPIWLELDRGTEAINQFKRKVRHILSTALSSQYEELFHTKAVTIAFATTADTNRLKSMREWVMQELKALEKQSESGLFLFTKITEGQQDSQTFFLGKIWVTPDDDRPLSLIM